MSSFGGAFRLALTSRKHWALLGFSVCLLVAGCAPGSGPADEPYRLTVGDKTLMNSVLEPNADIVWDAVGTVMTLEGTEEMRPETDEEWDQVRWSAITIAEAANLLMLPERAHDQDEWILWSLDLVDAGAAAMRATDARDVEALFNAGAEIYEACRGCHENYWPESQFVVQGQDF